MEEKVEKEVVTSERKQKLSYEQLESVAHQLSAANQKLHAELVRINDESYMKRFEFLFRVLDHEHLFSEVFVQTVISELEDSLILPTEKDCSSSKEDTEKCTCLKECD